MPALGMLKTWRRKPDNKPALTRTVFLRDKIFSLTKGYKRSVTQRKKFRKGSPSVSFVQFHGPFWIEGLAFSRVYVSEVADVVIDPVAGAARNTDQGEAARKRECRQIFKNSVVFSQCSMTSLQTTMWCEPNSDGFMGFRYLRISRLRKGALFERFDGFDEISIPEY
jgi:hypothetical protein